MDNKNNLIKRFFNILYAPDIPALYGQGLTDYEIIVRLAKVINTNADTMESWLVIAQKLEAVLNDMDAEIKKEVIEVVHEMYESGDFNEIFENLFEEFLNHKPLNSELLFRRKYRKRWNIGDNNIYAQGTAGDVIRPSKLEGGTYVSSYGGNSYYCYCLVPDGVHSYGHNNAGAIILTNAETMEIAGQVAVEMQHMNSMDFNPNDGYFYIAGCLSYTGNNSNTFIKNSIVYRIHINEILNKNLPTSGSVYGDLAHLSDTGAYHPNYSSIDLDNIIFDMPSSGDISSNCISWSNNLPANHIYCGTGYCRVYDIDFVNQTIAQKMYTEDLNNQLIKLESEIGWGNQTAVIHGDYLYTVIYRPNGIIRSNLKTQQVEYVYKLPQIADNGYFVFGEIEDIKIEEETGDIYTFCDLNLFRGNCRQYRMMQVFKSNIYNNAVPNSVTININKKEPLSLYVDSANAGKNPTGMADNPFFSLDEAVTFANNNEVCDAVIINMKTNSVGYIEVASSKKIHIRADSSVSDKIVIGGIACSGANCILQDLEVRMSLASDIPGGAYIYCYDSNLTCRNIFIRQNDTTIDTAYKFEYSFGNIAGTGQFTVESGKETSSNGVAWSGNTFISHTASTINAHGWASLNTGVIA